MKKHNAETLQDSSIKNGIPLKLELLQEGLTHHINDISEEFSKTFPEFVDDLEKIKSANTKLKSNLEDLPNLQPDYDSNLGEFWSKIRHDLKTPINAIKNYAEMIVEDLKSEEKKHENFISAFEWISRSAEDLVPLINLIGSEYKIDTYDLHASDDEDVWFEGEGTVLVIDDNKDNCDVLSRRLEKAGLTVLVANDGYKGLQTIREKFVDLVLLDIMMPGMMGYEVLERMKGDEKFKHIPVLMISSVSELSSIVRCIKIGADDYLPTPFNPVLLKARISAGLHKKRNLDREKSLMTEVIVARKQLETAIQSIEEGFAVFNPKDELVMHNAPFENMYPWLFQMGPQNSTYQDFLREGLANGTFMLDRRKNETPEDWYETRRMYHKKPKKPWIQRLSNGTWVEIHEYKTPDEGTVSIHKDITQRKREEEHLLYLAHHDPLTGLPNRAEFEDKLQNAFRKARTENTTLALLFMDLDGFKKVNDTLGHEFGDYLLIQVAARLKEVLREGDLVARLGGDEFCIIIQGYSNKESVEKVAKRVLESVGTSIVHNGHMANYGVSIGISIFPEGGKIPEDLMKSADDAMYTAKKAGKGSYHFYGTQKEKKKD
ncbi:Diguanylate cyclase domain-containing protein [Candidatus Bealeia paramacronuclearis]|uniref:histidine kinase n=1 Tax=Candidatus Bealeia paramacronuclearis TaxID=1921001 RepID=A0ABZ2C177_9PROT|nr:Diguanylate cyclase domain-containing protein [Candidatus Bealeia paramacronuclearis]